MPEMPAGGSAPYRIGAVILAAGASSRMGAAKQLLVLEGRSLIARAIHAVLESTARPVAVVLGANAETVRTAIAHLPVLTVVNPDWRDGMASSIRSGLAALERTEPKLDAVLIAPCDQPALSREVIERLAALHRASGRIAASLYGGRSGAPAIFGRRYFVDLKSLAGDEGARILLNSGSEIVAGLPLPEMEADLDTPSDVDAWRARQR